MRGSVVVFALIGVLVGTGVCTAAPTTADRALRDCRDGVLQGSYSTATVRDALRAPAIGPRCEGALRFELRALTDASRRVIEDCYADGRLDRRLYTRGDLKRAERDLPADVDEYSNCRAVIRARIATTPGASALARRARRVEVPLTVAKAKRYARRAGNRFARAATRIKYPKRIGVRTIVAQAHYQRMRDSEAILCFAEMAVTRSGRSGQIQVRRTVKVCD